MSRLLHTASFGLGSSRNDDEAYAEIFHNHFAAATPMGPGVKEKIASMGLTRVAGNIYECPSSKDFWKVKGNSIVRLTSGEVDNHEQIAAAPAQAPMNFLEEVLGSLEF